MIVARSFARIHETNLKVSLPNPLFPRPARLLPSRQTRECELTYLQKQGILPLWFANKDDYARISAHDKVTTIGLSDLLNGKADGVVSLKVTRPSGESYEIPTQHTMSADQLEWLRAGSALNYIGQQARKAGKA